MTTCPGCHSRNAKAESFLGALGWTSHFRCRYCGAGYSHEKRPRARKVAKITAPSR